MARIAYTARALADFDRLVAFLIEHESELSELMVTRVREAVSILAEHPLVGRPVEKGLRELVISRGRTGYLALYRFFEEEDVVLVLALRHQREAGYTEAGD
ncbi:MAG: type II toxin-antitoxin system RelE/ParE family toxin [Myxococcaceae bacterium]|nr:type II toxin-antitoxin system RelE/ParE family toxin [Myxococcaceae bacterium]MCI0671766.1 type II toxin-antitoxin system RelE/ParE family toxin [Myxococcaceae bacterium]